LTLKFGTDGLRGVAGTELTAELTVALGRAAARVLGGPRFLIGRDTRLSSSWLESALAAGLAAEGVDVELLGVLPTPGVAWHSASEEVPAAVISASHNPYQDNGIKLFSAGGLKLADDVEQRLERELSITVPASSGPVGLVRRRLRADEPYIEFLAGSLEGHGLDGLSVVLDCANGAASHVAPTVFEAAGCDVEVLSATPDGMNINAGCGSTHPEALQERVVQSHADVGLAFDGDADRVLAVDHTGRLIDGDHVLAMCAIDLAERDALKDRTVVVTVMTNLGFRLAMQERDIRVVETKVGDRYVLEALDAGGLSLGGEQSGHIIFRDLATTGDGVLTGLHILDLVQRSGRRLAELAAEAMTSLPQVLRNVRVADRGVDVTAAIAGDVADVEAELGDHGRVLIRPSGTEPLVRVMVEAPTMDQAESAAARLVAAVERATT
jgi:phosphoglucosamine mutase